MKKLIFFLLLFVIFFVRGAEFEMDPGLVRVHQALEEIAHAIEKQHDIQSIHHDLNELIIDDSIKKALIKSAPDAHKFPNWFSEPNVPFILHPQAYKGQKVDFGSCLKTFHLRFDTELDRAQNFAAIVGFFKKEQRKPQEFDDAVNTDHLPRGVLPNYFENPLTKIKSEIVEIADDFSSQQIE